MARLRDLNPRYDGFTLVFVCPACRKHDISVSAITGQIPAVHDLRGEPPDWDSVTISPSIATENARGIGKHCGWHGFITRGEAAPDDKTEGGRS